MHRLVCFFCFLSEFGDFRCDENVTAEIGKDININCTNNNKIIDMTVKFCINKTLCPNSSNITTYKKRTTADNGRITLEINNNSAILHISSVQISDQRMYEFFLYSNNGHKKIYVTLRVVGKSELMNTNCYSGSGLVGACVDLSDPSCCQFGFPS